MLNPQELDAKIKEYQSFLEGTLKKDLAELQETLRKKSEEYKQWEEVQQVTKSLNSFKQLDRDMTLRVNLGCDINALGEVSDYERTYIDVGLGLLLEMDCDEAARYSAIRLKALKKDIDYYRNLAVHVKVNIKLVLLAINELQCSVLGK